MVDGNTLLYATVGDPVAQIRAPQVMGAVFEKLAVNGVWVPMHVDQAGLLAVLQGLRTVRNFRAITVTIPHKQTVVAMLDRLSVAAQASGGVNMVRLDNDGKLFGDMVDGSGFVRGLELHGHHVQGAAVWLIGLGGGGSAIAAALAEARVARLYLTEMNRERATAVFERLGHYYPKVPIEIVNQPVGRVDFAINATPSGLKPGDPLPFDPAILSRETVICDIIMKPKETALIRAAESRGMRVHHGHHMLDSQIPMYLRFVNIPFSSDESILEIARQA